MEETFSWKSNRRKIVNFLLIGTTFSIIARITLFYVLHRPTTTREFFINVIVPFLDNLTATLIVSLFIAIVYTFLKPKEELLKLMIKRSEIEEELRISKSSTNEWLFSGGTGSETRKVTLPFLVKELNDDKIITVKLQVINPTNRNLCNKYSSFRKKRNNYSSEWNERHVQLMVYSTLISCVYWSQQSHLKVEVYFKNSFSTLRYDISDDRVIITKEDPNSPAYLVKKPNSFFNAILIEFKSTLDLAEKIDISKCDLVFGDLLSENSSFTKELLIDQFSKMGITENFTDNEFNFMISNMRP